MATNFQGYNSYDATRPAKLMIADIKVGDKLVRCDWAYNRGPSTISETVWTVTKVLKSRLVLTRVREHDGQEITVRVLVQNNKSWTYGNGEVQTTLEGDSGSWSRKSFYLFTPDEPKLAEIRASVAEAQTAYEAKRKAEEALEAFKRSMTVENAEFTIAALQEFIANKKDNA